MEERWEYITQFVFADIEFPGVKDYFKEAFSPEYKPPKYSPEAMIPELNSWGAEGWELVHMEPVAGVGKNFDVKFVSGGSTTGIPTTTWSNVYFCVLKRRIID